MIVRLHLHTCLQTMALQLCLQYSRIVKKLDSQSTNGKSTVGKHGMWTRKLNPDKCELTTGVWSCVPILHVLFICMRQHPSGFFDMLYRSYGSARTFIFQSIVRPFLQPLLWRCGNRAVRVPVVCMYGLRRSSKNVRQRKAIRMWCIVQFNDAVGWGGIGEDDCVLFGMMFDCNRQLGLFDEVSDGRDVRLRCHTTAHCRSKRELVGSQSRPAVIARSEIGRVWDGLTSGVPRSITEFRINQRKTNYVRHLLEELRLVTKRCWNGARPVQKIQEIMETFPFSFLSFEGDVLKLCWMNNDVVVLPHSYCTRRNNRLKLELDWLCITWI